MRYPQLQNSTLARSILSLHLGSMLIESSGRESNSASPNLNPHAHRVAIKRLPRHDFVLVEDEIRLVRDSAPHPNVIQYLLQEEAEHFLFLALPLCSRSLVDVVQKSDRHIRFGGIVDPKRAICEIARGVQHLHLLDIIHRGLIPTNILVHEEEADARLRMMVTDYGIVHTSPDEGHTTFTVSTTTSRADFSGGSEGWRARELLIRREAGFDLLKSVDIFPLGCLFYYVLTEGGHPFGQRAARDGNIIMKTDPALESLQAHGDLSNLVALMLSADPDSRSVSSSLLANHLTEVL